jgi:Zn finger protein HypA/HybF involved in hydrogenase expression
MPLRMKWFECPKCDRQYEDIVELEDKVSSECPVCGQKDVPILEDYLKQIHRDGNKYKHVSWSLWQAGN